MNLPGFLRCLWWLFPFFWQQQDIKQPVAMHLPKKTQNIFKQLLDTEIWFASTSVWLGDVVSESFYYGFYQKRYQAQNYGAGITKNI